MVLSRVGEGETGVVGQEEREVLVVTEEVAAERGRIRAIFDAVVGFLTYRTVNTKIKEPTSEKAGKRVDITLPPRWHHLSATGALAGAMGAANYFKANELAIALGHTSGVSGKATFRLFSDRAQVVFAGVAALLGVSVDVVMWLFGVKSIQATQSVLAFDAKILERRLNQLLGGIEGKKGTFRGREINVAGLLHFGSLSFFAFATVMAKLFGGSKLLIDVSADMFGTALKHVPVNMGAKYVALMLAAIVAGGKEVQAGEEGFSIGYDVLRNQFFGLILMMMVKQGVRDINNWVCGEDEESEGTEDPVPQSLLTHAAVAGSAFTGAMITGDKSSHIVAALTKLFALVFCGGVEMSSSTLKVGRFKFKTGQAALSSAILMTLLVGILLASFHKVPHLSTPLIAGGTMLTALNLKTHLLGKNNKRTTELPKNPPVVTLEELEAGLPAPNEEKKDKKDKKKEKPPIPEAV